MQKLESAKSIVDTIHDRLKRKRGIKNQMVNLDKLHTHLPKKLQRKFMTSAHHDKSLENILTLN